MKERAGKFLPFLLVFPLFSFLGFQGAVLGIVQGLSEFLPISSSAHLVLVRWMLGWSEFVGGPSAEKVFDVILHAGTLLALVWYFFEDLNGFGRAVFHKHGDPLKRKLVWMLLIGTVPGALFGVLFEKAAEERFSQPGSIAIFLFIMGVVLYLTDRFSQKRRTLQELSGWHALLIGMAQAFAVLPGISRSGVTMTSALLLGYTREDSARYSFLMSIPIIAGACLWGGHKLLGMHLSFHSILPFGWGFVMSTVVGYLCIRYFLRYLYTGNLAPFAVYRMILGIGILLRIHAAK